VSSGTGRAAPGELLVAPAIIDGAIQAVIELGFFRRTSEIDRELLDRVSETLAAAIRGARDRTKLEELLEETQRQSEELQTQAGELQAQQEELRVNNEELEEQSRALKESQARLENQQNELEQINANLEEQTQLLEHQKDALQQAQAALTEKAAELERSNQYKSEFLANMSHELRTPLNSSLILATLLADNKEGNLTEEQVHFARTIHEAGTDLLTLINDILDLSKIESGKVELSIEPVPLATTVASLESSIGPLADQKHLGFSVAVDPNVPEQITTDGQRLGQILKNLLSNAVKFTDRGQVGLRVSVMPDRRLAFAVTDTGIGIPAHQQEIIFEAFRQADGSTHRKYGGTGLGLSISRDLAHLLGGELLVHSEAGRGSVFTLILPTAYSAARPAAPALAPPAPPADRAAAPRTPPPVLAPTPLPVSPLGDDRDQLAPASRRLLIIEDDLKFAGILRDLARERGFQAIAVHTAGDAMRAADQYTPHAILLDVHLPDSSGLGVLDQLKRNPRTRHIPVHVLSVADHSQQALERGAVGYAIKPVNREQLLEAFQKLDAKLEPRLRRVLVVEDDDRQRDSVRQLLSGPDVEIVGAATASDALVKLREKTFDCVVMDLKLPDLEGIELLEQMAAQEGVSFPPVIVYTGRTLTPDEEHRLRRFSKSIIVKDARSPERLLDEVTLFLHQVEAALPSERQQMLKAARARDAALEDRRILIVEDDARNIFALSKVLEPRGAKVEIARNGREAIDVLSRHAAAGNGAIDLVLMDVMMPEMDGLTAMREIRRRPEWKRLPIIALTAKAMKDDQEKCLAAGANDYMAKPFDVEKLLSLVRVWMPK
jgi:CheY-like chemotaxis protein/signal transduction histidine kinase